MINPIASSTRILFAVLFTLFVFSSTTAAARLKANDVDLDGEGEHNDLQTLLRQRRDGGDGSYGGYGSHEGGVYQAMGNNMDQVLLQAILTAAAAEAAAPAPAVAAVPADAAATGGMAALPAPAPASPLSNPAFLLASLMSKNQGGGGGGGYYPPPYYGGGGDDDPNAALHSVKPFAPAPFSDSCEAAKICDAMPFQAIVQFHNNLLAFQRDNVYDLRQDGSFVTTVPRRVQNLFPGFNGPKSIDAAVKFNGSLWLFHTRRTGHSPPYLYLGKHQLKMPLGDECTEYRSSELPAKPQKPQKIAAVFPGVTTPIDGAFQLDNDTFIFISYHTFVKYQASKTPPVDLEAYPQFLTVISPDLKFVNSAFSTIDGQRFLISGDNMYEIDQNLKVISRKPVKTAANNDGWIKCPTPAQQGSCSGQKKESGKLDVLSTLSSNSL